MGFFSWLTADTKRSICNSYSSRKPFTVHMITEDGQVFTEHEYEGYGEFGGKDFYVLSAELNGLVGKDEDETRTLFFDKIWRRGIKKGDKVLTYREDFSHYEDPIISEGGLTPNTLVGEHGWESWEVSSNGDIDGFVKAGFKMPKIVKNLKASPNNKEDWKKFWDSLSYNKSCRAQGYFYDDDE